MSTEPIRLETNTAPLVLVSHHLCPYVQRAAVSLSEKNANWQRVDIDLAAKPDWFLAISPLGKTPVLQVGEEAIFESAVILEYLEEVLPRPLHPSAPLDRARHRAWMEFGSQILNDIAGLYNAPDPGTFQAKAKTLSDKFDRIEMILENGPWFDGEKFSLVDAVFGPIFRYFDVFDQIGDFNILTGKPKTLAWRRILSDRPSVREAVSADYPALLAAFLRNRKSHLSTLMSSDQI